MDFVIIPLTDADNKNIGVFQIDLGSLSYYTCSMTPTGNPTLSVIIDGVEKEFITWNAKDICQLITRYLSLAQPIFDLLTTIESLEQ